MNKSRPPIVLKIKTKYFKKKKTTRKRKKLKNKDLAPSKKFSKHLQEEKHFR